MSMPSLHQQPAWFGTVMGTGALGVLLTVQADIFGREFLNVIAIVLLWLASGLTVVLWPRYFRRLAVRDQLKHEVADPAHGAMLATFPAGLMVLSVGWGVIGPKTVPFSLAMWIAGILLVIGALFAVGYAALWASTLSRAELSLEKVNGGWLIPPVMNLLVPLALVPFIKSYPEQALWLLIVAFAFLGIGTLLFLALFSLLVLRLATKSSTPAAMAPSLWIPLAPAGVFGVAVVRLAQGGVNAELIGPDAIVLAVAFAAMGFGFGLWWALFAYIDLRRARRNGGVPFHIGWWGYVFPVVAMALSISVIDIAVGSVSVVAGIAGVIAVLVWLVVAVKTLLAVLQHRSVSG